MEKFYKMDIVVGDVVVELKSVEELNSAHRAQLFNYLRLTKKPIGLLINFGQPSLQGERYGYDEERYGFPKESYTDPWQRSSVLPTRGHGP